MTEPNTPEALAKIQRQLNAGSVSVALLALLDRAGQPMYGYELSKILERVTRAPLPMKQGTLYPVLRSLEREGLLASSLEPSDAGPPRRYYRVTPAGYDVLELLEGAWADTRNFVDRVLTGGEEIRKAIESASNASNASDDSDQEKHV
jgi:PadR family transcriptional regulator PadR